MKSFTSLEMNTIPDFAVLQSTYPNLKGLLFDMDGTLFDTEKYHTLALEKIGKINKIIPPLQPKEIHQLMIGKADHLLFEIIKHWTGFPQHWAPEDFVKEKNQHLIEILSEIDSTHFFHPNIKQLIQVAKKSHLQIALVTSSEKVVTTALLKIAKIENVFDFILTRDDSIQVKPSPWPYLKTMEELKLTPPTTLIFEDSEVGLEAAHASQAHVIKAKWY